MPFEIKRTNAQDNGLKYLVSLLDKELRITNTDEAQDVLDQYNIITDTFYVVVAFADGAPVGCGCFKPFESNKVEIKRMFVHPDHRQKGIAAAILAELENWAGELNYDEAVLETGTRLQNAVALYKKHGYAVRPQYGQYINIEHSICMQKPLTKQKLAITI